MFKDLRTFLQYLEDQHEVVRIGKELSPKFEIAAALKAIAETSGAAVYCSKVKGYQMPVVGNLLATRRRLAMALGVKGEDITDAYLTRTQHPVPPKLVRKAPVKEVVISDHINLLNLLPILTHHEGDAGPYLTSAITMAKDPESGIRGMGIHRIQVKGPDVIGLFLGSPPLSHFLERAEAMGKALEIAIAIGVDPLTYFASVIYAPQGIDKFTLAGGLAKRPIELVKAESVDLEVPAWAEVVLEGRLTPGKREPEGPFAESSGYYLTFDNPVATIGVITHRRKPIYHALMPFFAREETVLSASWEAKCVGELRQQFPGVLELCVRNRGVAVVQIDKRTEEEPFQVLDHLLQTLPSVKVGIAVDPDVDPYKAEEVDWALSTRLRPQVDTKILSDMAAWRIDPSAAAGKAAKLALDATVPLKEERAFKKIGVPRRVEQRVANMLRSSPGSRLRP